VPYASRSHHQGTYASTLIGVRFESAFAILIRFIMLFDKKNISRDPLEKYFPGPFGPRVAMRENPERMSSADSN
jgi:hypothetical protein